MCAVRPTMLKLTITNKGETKVLSCTQAVGNMLLSEETDASVKEAVINNLIHIQSQNNTMPITEPSPNNTMLITEPSPNNTMLITEPSLNNIMPITEPSQKNIMPITETSPNNIMPITEPSTSASPWCNESEKLLLEKFSAVEGNTKIKKNKWKIVADHMKTFGYIHTAEQCRLKIKNLKEKYQRKQLKRKKSGESPPTSEDDDEMAQTFEKFPDVKPNFLVDTGKAEVSRPETPSPSESSSDDRPSKSKRPRKSVEVMKDFMGEIINSREEAAERRHQEKMESVKALIDVLKEHINSSQK